MAQRRRDDWRQDAFAEYEDAFLRYLAIDPPLGVDFSRAVNEAIDLICRIPEAFAADSLGCRHRSLRRFPYAVIYRCIDSDVVEIVAVAHQRRQPDYWHDRLK